MAEQFSVESKFNFREMKLLIVDPNEFSGSLTRNICRSFRFGDISVLRTTFEAVDLLSQDEIDVVICDWALYPHSGEDFIRLVRTAPSIRNACVPLVVLTSINDRETILAARDVGIHDFLTRPLAVNRLATCLARILAMPQTFIRCETYVGPDRRRRQRPFDGPERRGRGSAAASFQPENGTAAKLSKSGGLTLGEMATAGELVITTTEEHYRAIRHQDLEQLFALTRELKETPRPDDDLIRRIYLKSNDLKGMGQTFGYPLLTDTGDLLCNLVWKLPAESAKTLFNIQGIEAHATVMKMIVDSDIRDDGGDLGTELVAGLRSIVDKACAAK